MTKNKPRLLKYTLLIIVLILFFLIPAIVNLITDYWWFQAVGFAQIFLISLKTKLSLFVVAAGVFFIFAAINLWISSKLKETKSFLFKFKILIVLAVSFIVGLISSSAWMKVLQYLNSTGFSIVDPIFSKDVSFYVFTLPFFLFIWKFALACLVLTLLLVFLDYLEGVIAGAFKRPKVHVESSSAHGSVNSSSSTQQMPNMNINFKDELNKIKRKGLVHLAVLGALIFAALAVGNYLTRYSVMYSEQGIVVGAGYTDVFVVLPVINLMIILSIIVAILFIIWIFYFSKEKRIRKRHILLYAIIVYFAVNIAGSAVLPGIVQKLIVDPNEINLEKPFLENNIKFTRLAYNLDNVAEKDFSVDTLTYEVIENSSDTINNVRILDYRPLTKTYKQTQEIRLYYDLSGIDIDRYNINGEYTQVMIAPRELDQNQIADNAKTWVNLHLVYTHGMGVVMSPVNTVTAQGLPNYYIKDIPPVTTVDEPSLEITQPRVYYGELKNEFVLVNSETAEFDYPKGNTNEYVNYDGEGGVKVSSFLRRLFFAIRFSDIKLLLSSQITDETKIMFNRNIKERISTITPFLVLDDDPYIVIDKGRLFWIQDAYTITNNFPYSQKFRSINYMRNAVKIVVDAYNGDVTYYVIDNDPLMKTYSKIFPDQFKSYDMMPEGLKEHIRYPEDLFRIQSEIYSLYHMEDTTVFYNKEDAWQIPFEIYGVGKQIPMEPYYIIIKLPGEESVEFVLITPFTPIRKDNMIAWLAARSDGTNYGKLLLYKFPKDKLVYGPLQIEARIDQDSEISQQITLWSQQGSKVTRGNLLVIPLKSSIIYIEPLYIESEKGQLPELKRVLVSDGEKVVMEENLAKALSSLFGEAIKEIEDKVKDLEISGDLTDEELIKQANEYYEQIEESMRQGDWTAIGKNLEKLGEILSALENE